MSKIQLHKLSTGQSLLEVIFALGIAAVVLISMAGLATTSVRNSTFSKNSVTTTQLAAQATEWLRSNRDSGWMAFVARASSPGTKWCIRDLAWPGAAGPCGSTDYVTGTNYIRYIVLTSKDIDGNTVIDTVDATIVVQWSDAQGLHESKNDTRFTDWRR